MPSLILARINGLHTPPKPPYNPIIVIIKSGAARALRMATIDGARALGLEKEMGSLEVGKRADVIVIALDQPHSIPGNDIVSSLVYSAQASDVRTTMIDGRVVMQEGELLTLDENEVIEDATREANALKRRAGLPAQDEKN